MGRGVSNARSDERNRGVSHIVGFVLVFAVVMASIGALYASGVGSLDQVRDREQVNNAERGMVALAQNFDAIHRGRAPGRAGEIRLSGGTLSVNDSSEFRLEVSHGGTVVQHDVGIGSLVYSYEDSTVRYETGAVFRGSEGSYMARQPAFECSPDRAIVSTITLRRGSGSAAVTKDGTVVLVGRKARTALLYPQSVTPQDSDTNTVVTFEVVSSPNEDAWGRYLTDHGWTKTGGAYECQTSRAYVRRTIIDVAIRA